MEPAGRRSYRVVLRRKPEDAKVSWKHGKGWTAEKKARGSRAEVRADNAIGGGKGREVGRASTSSGRYLYTKGPGRGRGELAGWVST